MYDFTTLVDRSGTNSLKWNVSEGELPLWVADMDFRTAPCITEAAVRAARRGLYGYTILPPAFPEALRSWFSRRYGWEFATESVLFTTGVMPAVHSLVRTFTRPADKILVMTPVYHCFFQAIEENGRTALASPLSLEADGSWRIDFDRLRRDLSDPACTMLLLCNPHNPTGNLWDEATLRHIGDLAADAGVTIVSDEIHGDLTDPGERYVPFQRAASAEALKRTVTCVSPSKTFNIPALGASALVIPDARMRARAASGLHRDQIGSPGALVVEPLIAAYAEGEPWLEEALVVLARNKRRVVEFVRANLPKVRCLHPKATYLLWLDVSAYGLTSSEMVAHLRRSTGLILSPGDQFRGPKGEWLRLNAGTQAERLEDALSRLKRGLELLEG